MADKKTQKASAGVPPITWDDETLAGLAAYLEALREAYQVLVREDHEGLKALLSEAKRERKNGL